MVQPTYPLEIIEQDTGKRLAVGKHFGHTLIQIKKILAEDFDRSFVIIDQDFDDVTSWFTDAITDIEEQLKGELVKEMQK